MYCWRCGKKATRTLAILREYGAVYEAEPSEKYRSYCARCAKEVRKEENEEHALYVKLRKRIMFRRACDLLEAQDTDMYSYKEAIEVVGDYIEKNPDKIDSAYEALTAIILVQNRIYSKMQYKVGKYQVDFLLPEMMIVLEIDGERHKHRKNYDSERDKEIKWQLGPAWEIVRIQTENLDKNAKALPTALQKVLEYRGTRHINWREL